ncbi:toll/interleukin-1 receptor domain-containing protein [Nostoc sp. UHCC 0870]|uniref:toll/interleukin-1 receptor domain-containing protein n=1 Tax=Nostoc sp. UHCC 0870 TaxID=2914041 RepID=UPI001EE0B89E|nr:toll/interleukin-1 receptor domain-containing protein [Nostoc sp. UHCC 0870]UKO98769.1 toll/interleukin-1 receptor domain-containing protein [Nostoc sp. UHCC 0870]
MSNTVKVFFSYSHKDEALRDELATHLSMMKPQGVIEAWHVREISAGREWANAIDEQNRLDQQLDEIEQKLV